MKLVRVPGSCGELVQGMEEEQLFLVTCPVNLFATASLVDSKYHNGYKIAKARRLTLDYLGATDWLNIKVESQLLLGKGMASSSADIAATIELIGWELGRKLSVEEIGAIAAKIEPTDGVFCPGIVKYAYREGKLLASLGNPPPMEIMIFDEGGTVNTMRFNRQAKVLNHYRAKEKDIKKALQDVTEGIKNHNLAQIGSGATLSGYLNQDLLYKKYLEDIIFISEGYGALGVNVAHSGTVMGVLFPGDMDLKAKELCKEEILGKCAHLNYLATVSMIAGGIELEEV